MWSDREKENITRIKTATQAEIMDLRRKANNKAGYDEVSSQKTIAKLRKENKELRDQLRNKLTVGSKNSKCFNK